MSGEKPKAVVSNDEMRKTAQSNPTPKDAGRLFAIMFSLLFAIIGLCSIFAIVTMDDNFGKAFGGFFSVIPVMFTIMFSLPALIIGANHRKERDFYNLFMWIGIIVIAAALIGGAIAFVGFASMFKR